MREPVEIGDPREPVELDLTVAGLQSGPGSERAAHGSMLSDASAKLGDRLTMHGPRLAPDLGLALTALLLIGLGDQRWDRSRLALVVERDEHEVRAGAVGPPTGLELLGFDTDADLERGRSTSFTDAFTVTVSPTWTGARNDISSIETVTHRPPACLNAASPAAVSTSFITTPPCTMPAMLASVISISWTSVTWLDATRRGSRCPTSGF